MSGFFPEGRDPGYSAEIGIDAAEIGERREFLEFSDQDVELLAELHTLFESRGDAFIDEFYRHLRRFPVLGAMLADPGTLARLRRSQAQYFSSLTGGDYGPDYIETRLAAGRAHHKMSLAPKWYICPGAVFRFTLGAG